VAERDARRTFGPVVLLGLAASGAVAVAGHRAMLEVSAKYLQTAGLTGFAGQDTSRVQFPLAGALALVALACWGVLLVTRGVVRRVVAVLSGVAAAGMLAVAVLGGFVQNDDAAADMSTRLGLGGAPVPLDRTAWLWIALAGSLLALVASVAAVRFVGSWPEMGARYDAPTVGGSAAGTRPSAAAAAKEPEEQSNLDLWKSLDEGDDPTVE
jgi:uncharacterized membrane protein (TIGR02234 family)